MPVALLSLGIVSVLAGLLMAYGGYANFDFSYGGTLVIAASVAILGGLLTIGVAACLAQLRRIARMLAAAGRAGAAAQPMQDGDAADAADAADERRLPVLPPRPAGRKGEAPADALRPAARADIEPARASDEPETAAGRPAADWPRVSAADRFGLADASGSAAERRSPPAERDAPAFDDISPSPQPASPIVKSGVIEGMAYTLYADGSVEAELPQGIMRFASVTDWRDYLKGEA